MPRATYPQAGLLRHAHAPRPERYLQPRYDERGRLALALLGAAAAAKLYAFLLAPLALAWLWRERGRRAALEGLAAFTAVAAVLVVPWIAIE